MVLLPKSYEWIEARHWLRLLPSTVTGHPLGLTVWRHYGLPRGRNLICPMTWTDRQIPCALCRLFSHVGPGRRPTGVSYLWARTYTNGIDRRNVQAGVQIVDLPLSCDEWITEATRCRIPYGNPYGDITDPATGRDVLIESPRRKRERYKTALADPSPLHDDPDVVARWLGERFDIESLFPVPGEAALAEIRAMADELRGWIR